MLQETHLSHVNATVEIVDTTAPTITVSNLTITLKIGESYTPPTFGVTDNDPAYTGICHSHYHS